MKSLLLDTGPMLALLDRSDPAHTYTVEAMKGLSGPLITTGPVITEAMFHLENVPNGPSVLASLLIDLHTEIEPVFDPASLTSAAELMLKYADTPMDFADASLVIAAGRLDIGRILTLDERGFRTYRYSRSKKFQLVLQARSR